jgi:PPOX class probable FMN-dependent enzyme
VTDSAADPRAAVDAEDLRELYREPHPLVLKKQQPKVDEVAATLVAAATLVVFATSGSGGTDASPRGGPPGFVTVLDDGDLAFGDLSGNNRLDSYRNVLENPEVGLLFVVPGMEETLRVNGRAHLSTDDDVLDRTTIDGRRPKVAVVVEVRECFVHCGKALRRAGLWEPSTWPEKASRPSPAAALKVALELDVDPQVIEDDLEAGYQVSLWEPGGR